MDEENKVKFQVRENKIALFSGIFAIVFAAVVFVLLLLYSPRGDRGFLHTVLMFLPLVLIAGAGAACCVIYHYKKLTVDGMNICYVNSINKQKCFTLDEIGYFEMSFTCHDDDCIKVYDLMGNKLCKLGRNMKGAMDFFYYLRDNGVKAEYTEKTRHFLAGLGYEWGEKGICEEQIKKCSEEFYDRMGNVFAEWEKQNKRFDVHWEFGLAEYSAADLGQGKELREFMWKCKSSVQRPGTLPEDYVCILEAYLKKGDEYVMDKRGRAVSFFLPFIERTKSYQVGERLRLRKMDDGMQAAYAKQHMELLARELPKRKYHTEALEPGHELRKYNQL